MTRQDLDELAVLLGGDEPSEQSAKLPSSVEPTVTVSGFGQLRFPMTAAQAKKLIAHGEPAPYGMGEQTLVDSTVRHTWHFPKAAVEVDWRGGLEQVLENARSALGLPTGARLEAEFHSLLVYERGQFFAPHQDSEKHDAMVATLVVVLPCPFSGGELVVHNGDDDNPAVYPGSRTETTMVALYADALHEVLPVRTGHRIALTYNLLLHGDTQASADRPAARNAVDEAQVLLTRHFETPEAPRWGGEATIPTRAAYLLDHNYTPRALASAKPRLKGVDAERAAILTEAARLADCEVSLALADIHEVRNDFEYDDDDYLIDSSVAITHWRSPDGTVDEVDLGLGLDEPFATKPSRELRAYAREHTGYMGNYGNTVDRWYHRGALLIWPNRLAFANRAEAAPDYQLRSVLQRLADRDDAAVTRDLAGLLPLWPSLVRSQRSSPGTAESQPSQLFTHALSLAHLLSDQAIADALIAPFSPNDLTPQNAEHLITLTDARGEEWTRHQISQWFSHAAGAWHVALSADWVGELPRLCGALRERPAVAAQLLESTCAWLRPQIAPLLQTPSTQGVRQQLASCGALLAALLGGVGEIDDPAITAVRNDVLDWCAGSANDAAIDLLVPALQAADEWPEARLEGSGIREVASLAKGLLTDRLNRPQRTPDDWSIDAPTGCDCDLCEKLADFLSNRNTRKLEWPIAKPKRQHIHNRIDAAELPVTHTTRRVGSPYVLVLTKLSDLFDQEAKQRTEAARQLTQVESAWGE